LLEWLIGSLIVGFVMAGAAFGVTYAVIGAARRR
jgi:hypothetical protein